MPRPLPRLALAALAVLGAVSPPAAAQPKPAPTVTPLPQAPTLNPSLPLGAQRGTTLELTLTGGNLQEPTGLLTSFPAKVTIPAEGNNGKNPAKLLARLEVPADAPLGLHTLRLATRHGLSNALFFCVDELPQITETDANRSRTSAQPVPVPVVVAGRTDAEVSDYFRFPAKAGQRLSFDVLARRIGSPLDPIIALYDAATGRELPGVYCDDAPGLQGDARLSHTFERDGEYLVEVRDATHRGGGNYFYRLRIGEFPGATTPIPVAVKRGAKATVTFAGPEAEGVSPVELAAPADPALAAVPVAPRRAGGTAGWPVEVLLSDVEEIAEQEPNGEAAKATRLPVPGGATGRFLEKGDLDVYAFAGKKGQRYVLTAQTYEIHSPAEVYIVLKDATGKELAKSKPEESPRIEFNCPADGDYFLWVEHLNFSHGPGEVYHLTLQAGEPDFEVSLGLDRFAVAPGGTAAIPVASLTRRGYAGAVELTVEGHPGLGGSFTIPAGKNPQPNVPIALLPLTANPDIPPGPYAIRVRAKGVADGREIVRYASADESVKQAMNDLAYPPRGPGRHTAVAVTAPPPFTVAAPERVELTPGVPAAVTVKASRSAGIEEQITLQAIALPPNVNAAVKPIPKGQGEAAVTLTADPKVALGTYAITFRGASKVGGKDFAIDVPPVLLELTLPFALKVEPAELKLKPGEKAKLKVIAERKGGYKGPIAVEFRNLPAKVTAPKVTIAEGANEAEVEVTAAADAAAGEKKDVSAQGTATGAGNQKAATPNFTLRVEK